MFQIELIAEESYQVSIGTMRLKLSELQESDNEIQKIRAKRLKSDYEKVDGVMHHEGYFLSQKPFKQSSSVDTTTTRLQDILVLTR